MKTISDIWFRALKLMERDFTRLTISTWFDDAGVVEFENDRFVISTPHQMKKDIIISKYADSLKAALRELFSQDIDLLVLTPEELAEFQKEKLREEDRREGEDHSFSTFVVGSSNKFAHAAAVAVARNPASAYNPLFIYGPSGLGKTHLLYAIAGTIKKDRPNYKITYVTGEDFTNELINAISARQTPEFRAKYRQIDLLLVDDIQFIAGKDSTQEEFFHTFNALHEARSQIVLTSDRTPKEINRLEDRLKTRFEWGLLADISPPDYETRSAIIISKANHLGITLTPDVVEFIAGKITDNVRQLEGAVKKMMALSTFLGLPLDLDTARQAIDDIFREHPGLNPTPEYIISEASRFFGVGVADITGARRGQDIMIARQTAIYLVRRLTKLSLPEIGTKFGGRDHTTVMHSLNKIEDLLKQGGEVKKNIETLLSNIRDK